MKKIIPVILVFNISFVFSQLSKDQELSLANSLHKKINSLRKQKGLHLLEKNEKLAESAKLHADFMASSNTTAKEQSDALYSTTENRVKYHSNNFNAVSENTIKTKAIPGPFHPKKIGFVAQIVFNTWKKSPESYKNMISGDYNYADFGISYNTELKQFFISQVFGNKPYRVSNQLSETGFGIKEHTNCTLSEAYQNTLKSLATHIYIKDDEIFLDKIDSQKIAEIITSDNDGFAVDLITKDQIQCGVVNKVDTSPIYDGILLKPVYKNQILNHKKISLGKIPDAVKGRNVSANLIVLKGNAKCQYITANNSSKSDYNYDLLPVEIELEKPNIDLRNQGIYIAKEVFFDFETSKSTTQKYTDAKFDLDKVKTFSVKSYTSVDGSESSNKILQNKRAQFIKNHIGSVLGFSLDHVDVRIDAKENWELYNYQLKLHGHKDMLKKSKSEKRAFANGTLRNKWDKQFDEQRKSKIVAFQHGYWNRNNKQHGFYNLLNGLTTNDEHLVNKSLLWLYDKEVNYDLNKDYILDRLLTNKNLVQNVAALFHKNLDKYELNNIVFFLDHWLADPEILSDEAQKNLLNLYAATTLKIVSNWNEDNQNLARIIHPENVERLFKVYKAKVPTNSLFMNYHIAKAEYFKKTKQEAKINESLDFILSNFNKYNATTEETVNLAAFLKQWKHTEVASELLFKEYESNKLNGRGALLLTQMLSNYYDLSNDTFKEINQVAINANKEQWCSWISLNFQKLTDNNIKKLYCSSCNN